MSGQRAIMAAFHPPLNRQLRLGSNDLSGGFMSSPAFISVNILESKEFGANMRCFLHLSFSSVDLAVF
jgi:hypothetical protein